MQVKDARAILRGDQHFLHARVVIPPTSTALCSAPGPYNVDFESETGPDTAATEPQEPAATRPQHLRDCHERELCLGLRELWRAMGQFTFSYALHLVTRTLTPVAHAARSRRESKVPCSSSRGSSRNAPPLEASARADPAATVEHKRRTMASSSSTVRVSSTSKSSSLPTAN